MKSCWSCAARRQSSLSIAALSLISLTSPSTSNVVSAEKADDSSYLFSLTELSPVAPIRIFRPNPNLEIAFDVRTRTPLYVLERLVVGSINSLGRRRYRFYEESALPPVYRARNGHYHRSGYDRGHLAPAADFEDHETRNDSFNLTNVAPQAAGMNRKIWAALEHWTRNVARRNDGSETYVVTGPLWLPVRQIEEKLFEYRYPALGRPPSLVAVPTHFFKVIIVVNKNPADGGSAAMIQRFACFVISNDNDEEGRQLQDYVVRWSDLEAVSGLALFPALSADEEWKARADAETNRFFQSRESSSSLLLLTDGSPQGSSSSLINKRYKASTGLTHLCQDGHCALPYSKPGAVAKD
jgi:endonuclease G